jgi:hypothetical protein
MKFRTPELFLGALLAVAIFAMGMLFASSVWFPIQNGELRPGTEQQVTNKVSENSGRTQSLWIPTDSVGLYTLVLAIFSALLVGVSGAQGYLLLRADRTARIVADAAKKSAEVAEAALFKVEVAYPYAVIRDHWIDVEQNRIRGVNMGTVVSFYFTNHGRTPAAITEVFCQLYCEKGIPPPILPPDRPYNWLDGAVVPAGHDSKDFTFNMNQGMFDGFYAGQFADESNIVWLMGYARYEDVFDNKYILGFCFAFGTEKAAFYPVGGDGYNYRKKIRSAGQEAANMA